MKASPRRAARRVARQARYVRRNGNTLTFAIGSVGAVAVLSLLGWWTFGGVSGDETPEFLTTEVSRGAYDFVVIEQGTVESATNTELRCQVRSRGGGGGGGDRGSGGGGGGSSTTILDVVPEGTMVKKGTRWSSSIRAAWCWKKTRRRFKSARASRNWRRPRTR